MRVLLPLPVVLPLLGAGLSMAAARRRWLQRAIGIGVLSVTTAVSVAILVGVDRDGPAAAFMGGWEAPVGISLVADRFSALLLAVASPVLVAVLIFAIGQPGTEREQPGFHPVYLVLAAGVALSFLTGDLFNLFVAFEMMLTASYVLITIGVFSCLGFQFDLTIVAAMLTMLPKFALVVMQMYFKVLAKVRRPSRTPAPSTLRSLCSRITSALSLATSTAPSTEMPTSAACKAGASLMPSPM